MSTSVGRARAAFERTFGRQTEWIARAAGRVNLIGEHTDYNEGLVLPMAIDRHVAVTGAQVRGISRSRLLAADLDEVRDVDERRSSPEDSFADYAVGVLRELRERGIEIPPFEAAIAADLPRASGLSSSAALTVALAHFFLRLAERELSPLDVALVAKAAENRFVGVQCGIMDPFVIAHARDGAALRIDCRSLEFVEVPAPIAGHEWVVLHSGVPRALAASAYNQRRAECERAVAALQTRHAEVRSLRDARLEWLDGTPMDAIARRRATHVVAENERVRDCERAMRSGDVAEIGRLFAASHASLRDLYEVSCPELDARVGGALAEGAAAARMTGAGFGGCIVALFPANGAWHQKTALDVGRVESQGVEPGCWKA